MVERTHCPNCEAKLDADGTCHKCWWRPPRLQRTWSRAEIAIGVLIAMIIILACAGIISALIGKWNLVE
jgi:predicted amidophosphoribosyltransferase